MSTRLDAVMAAAGFNQADLNRWIDERDPWNLSQWLADNPEPHTDEQAAELADHIARRQRLVDEYRATKLPADFAQRVQDAIAADAERWRIQELATPAVDHAAGQAGPGENRPYVQSVLDREFARLAAATEGCRNDTLLKVACRIFEFVKSGHASHDGTWDELRRTATHIGLPADEIERTLRSAWRRVGPARVPLPAGRRPDPTTFQTPATQPPPAPRQRSRRGRRRGTIADYLNGPI